MKFLIYVTRLQVRHQTEVVGRQGARDVVLQQQRGEDEVRGGPQRVHTGGQGAGGDDDDDDDDDDDYDDDDDDDDDGKTSTSRQLGDPSI